MKIRIKFSKQGEMRFIGHLDLMRFFQKVIRRAGLDIKFSEGMSPHMVMSFASPLGIGLTSRGEYVDIELNTPVTTEEGLARLNAVSAEGVTFLDLRQIEEGKAGKAMSLVAAADYELRFRKGHEPQGDWQSAISSFAASDEILVEKESKKAAKKEAAKKSRGKGRKPARAGAASDNAENAEAANMADRAETAIITDRAADAINADGADTALNADSAVDSLQEQISGGSVLTDIKPMIYHMHVNAGTVYMKLASGSAANLKPEMVMKAYCDLHNIPVDPFAFEIERVELYADLGKNGKHRFVSLTDLGQIITEDLVSQQHEESLHK